MLGVALTGVRLAVLTCLVVRVWLWLCLCSGAGAGAGSIAPELVLKASVLGCFDLLAYRIAAKKIKNKIKQKMKNEK
ncbi:hypothetical protein BDW69DRAFT_154480 [Aspergillus filifer]